MDRLSEIEERLANATPGPWKAYGTTVAAVTGPGDCGGCSGLISPEHEPSCYWSEIAGAGEPDAELIAHAPADLAALVAFAREIEARHRPVHPDWVRPGDRICEECTDAAAYAAGVSYVAWPCPTAAAVQKLGEGS